jgi:hypothetical protein
MPVFDSVLACRVMEMQRLQETALQATVALVV